MSITNIGIEKFLVEFDIYAVDNTLDKTKNVVQSDIESIMVGTEKDFLQMNAVHMKPKFIQNMPTR